MNDNFGPIITIKITVSDLDSELAADKTREKMQALFYKLAIPPLMEKLR